MEPTMLAELGLVAGAQPVRNLRRRTVTPSWDGMFSSSKAVGSSDFESLLERDCQVVLSGDPRVSRYACQPHTLTYFVDADSGLEKREYTPDFMVQCRDGAVFVLDAKAAFFASSQEWKRLEVCIRHAYREDYGIEFSVWTEAVIRAEPRFSNLKTLHRHRFCSSKPKTNDAVRRILLESCPGLSIRRVCFEAYEKVGISKSEAFGAVMRMALTGEVTLDMSRRIDLETEILGLGWG